MWVCDAGHGRTKRSREKGDCFIRRSRPTPSPSSSPSIACRSTPARPKRDAIEENPPYPPGLARPSLPPSRKRAAGAVNNANRYKREANFSLPRFPPLKRNPSVRYNLTTPMPDVLGIITHQRNPYSPFGVMRERHALTHPPQILCRCPCCCCCCSPFFCIMPCCRTQCSFLEGGYQASCSPPVLSPFHVILRGSRLVCNAILSLLAPLRLFMCVCASQSYRSSLLFVLKTRNNESTTSGEIVPCRLH